MSTRKVVIFERDGRHTDNGKPELDFRLVRQTLPVGSTPLAIADKHGFTVHAGQHFGADAVAEYARKVSGYQPAHVPSVTTLDGLQSEAIDSKE